MVKKNIAGFVSLVFMAIVSFGAMAAEEGVVYDGKIILMTDVSDAPSSDGRVFHSKDFPDGVYVRVAKMFHGERYPDLEAIVRECLAGKGFKMADNMEGSSMELAFTVFGKLSLEDANNKAAHSNRPNGVNVAGTVGAALVAGAPGAIAFMAGSVFPTDSRTSLTAMSLMKPVKTKGLFGGEGLKSSVDGGTFTNGIAVKYKLEKDKEATEDAIFKMLVDQWMKRYVINDAEPVAASAVTATEPLVEAKK